MVHFSHAEWLWTTISPPWLRFLKKKATGHTYDGLLPNQIKAKLLRDINIGKKTITDADRTHIIATYDAEIRSMDAAFGSLIDGLKKRGLYDNTFIIFTSDHGEELGEHGRMGWHSHALWDEQLLVPLLVKFPNQIFGGTQVKNQVRSIDILPTVVDVLGIDPLKIFEGETLISLAEGKEEKDRPAVSQLDVKRNKVPVSLRTRDWKYYELHSRTRWLINLNEDPKEQVNSIKQKPQQVMRMIKHLDALLSARQESRLDGGVQMDKALKEQLIALGYIGKKQQ